MNSESSIASVTVLRGPASSYKRHLKGLFWQTWPLNAVIMVDNAPTDGTGEPLRGEYPQVTLLLLPEDFGVGAAFPPGLASQSPKGAIGFQSLTGQCSRIRCSGKMACCVLAV